MPNSFFNQPVYIPGGNPETMNEPEDRVKAGQIGVNFAYNIPARSAPGTETAAAGRPKGYKMVRTDSTMAVAPYDGAVAWYADQAQYRTTTLPTALGRGRVAGVYRTTVTPGNVCCIQTKGPGKVKFIDAVTAAPTDDGLFVVPSATAGKADCLAAGTAATYPKLGRSAGAYNAPAAEAIVDLDVDDVL